VYSLCPLVNGIRCYGHNEFMNSEFATFFIILLYIVNNCVKILRTYRLYTIVGNEIWTWFARKCCMVFAIQLSLTCFVNKGVKSCIYHNYTIFSYKSKFNTYFLSHIFKWNKWKFILEFFFKGLHIYNKETYKVPNHLKEDMIFFFWFNNNSQNMQMRKYYLTSCNFVYAK